MSSRKANVTTTSSSAGIRIGSSGFSFADWKGEFYPAKMPQNQFLEFYAERFGTLEINSTYYGIPAPSMAESMLRRTPESFDFMVKAHRSFTHERSQALDHLPRFMEAIRPFSESGRLSGVLTQFPYSFKSSPANLDYLLRIPARLPDQKVFVEFRHDSWYKREIFRQVREAGLHWVSVDLPDLSNLPKPHALCSHDHAYLRLHGRNAERWYGGGDRRYDYGYSKEELAEWKAKIKALMSNKARQTHVFFNNCYRGQAVKNARELIEFFDI